MNKQRLKKLEQKIGGKERPEIKVYWEGVSPAPPPKPGERVIKIKWPGAGEGKQGIRQG